MKQGIPDTFKKGHSIENAIRKVMENAELITYELVALLLTSKELLTTSGTLRFWIS